jgi:hypothetical protein
MSMKSSNDTIGNRTRDLPACSAVPQPTAPPRASGTEGSRGITVPFLTSTLDEGGWSTSRPGRFTPGKKHGTNCTGGWVGPMAGLDECWKFASSGIWTPNLPARSELRYPGRRRHISGVDAYLHLFLGIRWGELWASRLACFIPGTNVMGGLGGPHSRSGLFREGKKCLASAGNWLGPFAMCQMSADVLLWLRLWAELPDLSCWP